MKNIVCSAYTVYSDYIAYSAYSAYITKSFGSNDFACTAYSAYFAYFPFFAYLLRLHCTYLMAAAVLLGCSSGAVLSQVLTKPAVRPDRQTRGTRPAERAAPRASGRVGRCGGSRLQCTEARLTIAAR